MNSLTRRDFFARFQQSALEWVKSAVLNKSDVKPAVPVIQEPKEFSIGKLAEWSPGLSKTFVFEQVKFEAKSNQFGVWVVNPRLQKIALKLSPQGEIMAAPMWVWPKNKVLSHLSGGAIELDFEP